MRFSNDIFSNSDVSLLPPYEVVKNYLPHSVETEASGWHRDCGGEESINQCKSILSNQEYVFGKIGLYLQDNTEEFGGGIDVVVRSHKVWSRFPIPFLNYLFTRLYLKLHRINNKRRIRIPIKLAAIKTQP